MKSNHCLSEQELVLHYYGELATNREQAHHLADCPLCGERLTALGKDLAQLPKLAQEPDPAAGIRMAARVSEQLNGKRRSWLPALGASAVAACALAVTLTLWSPQEEPLQTAQLQTPSLTTMDLNEDMPDIYFLDDLELLKELDLLSQIEGV
jgi:negative regulator of sigma E activity